MGVRQGVHNTGKNITFSSIQTSQVLFFDIFCIFGYTLHLITKVQRCPNFPKSLPPFSDQELSGNDICFLWCVFFPLLNSYLNVPFVGFYLSKSYSKNTVVFRVPLGRSTFSQMIIISACKIAPNSLPLPPQRYHSWQAPTAFHRENRCSSTTKSGRLTQWSANIKWINSCNSSLSLDMEIHLWEYFNYIFYLHLWMVARA